LCADDLPVWGFIGEKETEIVHGVEQNVYYLFTHYIFSITHNGDQVCVKLHPATNTHTYVKRRLIYCGMQIIEVNWEHDPEARLDITDATAEIPVTFRYSSR
jgi:hypothetical protein